MLSQLHGTRYTIMAIVMATGLMFAAPRSSHAVTIEFDITVRDDSVGVTAGTVKGQFTGEDNNPTDNMISINELTDIQAAWTPDPTYDMFFDVPASFALGFAHRQRFIYDATTSPPTIDELFLASGDRALVCGPSRSTFTTCTAGQPFLVFVSDPGNVYTIANINIDVAQTAIPEPSTWLLLGTGLVGLMGYAFSRRVRPVATRRAPVAGA